MADALPPFALPELGRSLRSLGSVRNACEERAHAAVFGPLLEARAKASAASSQADILDALRGRALAARIERLTSDAVRVGTTNEASARARTAQARELLEPLLVALEALDSEAALIDPSSRIDGYRAYVDALTGVFAAADVACGRLSELLGSRAAAPRSGWLRGRQQ